MSWKRSDSVLKMWHLTSTLQRPNKEERERRARAKAAKAAAAAAETSSVTGISRAKTFRHNRNKSAGHLPGKYTSG